MTARLLSAGIAVAAAAVVCLRARNERPVPQPAPVRPPAPAADVEDVLANAYAILGEFLLIIHPDESPTVGEITYADLGITAGIIATREAAVTG